MLYMIETQCFTKIDHCLFAGSEEELRAWLDELSGVGWMQVCAYELEEVWEER
jgi:hypothetical protein